MTDTALDDRIERVRRFLQQVSDEVGKVIVGQERLRERLLMALVCDGHVLLEGVPGLAKSLTVSCLAEALGLRFQRIQFTPDLLPADLIGTQILTPGSGEFRVKRGPLFTQIVLADEINRAPPKVQSALLEAMQERQLTIGERTDPLPVPFLVLATQNPIEQEGTYPLPEAELDRFLLKVRLDYPEDEEEQEILRRHGRTQRVAVVTPVAGAEESVAAILEARAVLDEVHVDETLLQYVVRLARATRDPARAGRPEWRERIRYGVSPRASLALLQTARAQALLEGRGYLTPRDVKEVAPDVLRHRIVLSFEAEALGVCTEDVVRELLDTVEVP